jgi:hypothetical protein
MTSACYLHQALQLTKKRTFVTGSAMSALGQKQTCAAHKLMSALPPKADMCGATSDVRFGPEAEARFHSNSNVTPVGVRG